MPGRHSAQLHDEFNGSCWKSLLGITHHPPAALEAELRSGSIRLALLLSLQNLTPK